MTSLYLPVAIDLSRQAKVRSWYQNISVELSAGFLSPTEAKYFTDYYMDAGLLTPARRRFFERHYVDSFARSSHFLLSGRSSPLIVDLGCGAGTQSLYLALLGARVVGIDMDDVALDIFRARLRYYEDQAQRKLDIRILRANVFDFDFGSLAPIEGVYSMFAFNMMKPSRGLVAQIAPALGGGARLAVIDGNNVSLLARIARRRTRDALSPHQFSELMRIEGFDVVYHAGGVVLPPFAWNLLPRAVLQPVDGLLGRYWIFPVSHVIHAQKRVQRRPA